MPYSTPGEAMQGRLTTAVVGTPAEGHVSPTLPEQDVPTTYVVHYRTAGGGSVVLAGKSKLQKYTYRVDVYSTVEDDGEAVLKAITADQASGGLSGWSDSGNGVQGVFPVDDADTQVTDSANVLRVPGQSFEIWFTGG